MKSLAEQIEDCIESIYEREQSYAHAKIEAVEAKHKYKIRYAVEFRLAEGTAESRRHLAEERTAQENLEKEQKEAVAEIAYQFLQDARQVLIAKQSLLKEESRRPF